MQPQQFITAIYKLIYCLLILGTLLYFLWPTRSNKRILKVTNKKNPIITPSLPITPTKSAINAEPTTNPTTTSLAAKTETTQAHLTQSPASTLTPVPTQSAILSPVHTQSATQSPGSTSVPTPSPVHTHSTTPSPVPTKSATPSPVPTKSTAPSPVNTQSATPSPVHTQSATMSPGSTSVPTPSPGSALNLRPISNNKKYKSLCDPMIENDCSSGLYCREKKQWFGQSKHYCKNFKLVDRGNICDDKQGIFCKKPNVCLNGKCNSPPILI